MTGLADPAKPVVVPDLLAERGWTDLDYLKIDIDGVGLRDPAVLRRALRAAAACIAVQLEVNFVGTDQPDEHTFHNTDRFMRAPGLRPVPPRRAQLLHRAPCPPATSGRRRPRPCRAGRSRARPTTRATCWRPIARQPARAERREARQARGGLLGMGRARCRGRAAARDGATSWRRCSTSTPASTCWPPRRRPERSRPLSYRDYMATFEADCAGVLPARGSGADMGAPQVGLARLLVPAREAALASDRGLPGLAHDS